MGRFTNSKTFKWVTFLTNFSLFLRFAWKKCTKISSKMNLQNPPIQKLNVVSLSHWGLCSNFSNLNEIRSNAYLRIPLSNVILQGFQRRIREFDKYNMFIRGIKGIGQANFFLRMSNHGHSLNTKPQAKFKPNQATNFSLSNRFSLNGWTTRFAKLRLGRLVKDVKNLNFEYDSFHDFFHDVLAVFSSSWVFLWNKRVALAVVEDAQPLRDSKEVLN